MTDSLHDDEEQSPTARKKEIISELRALVETPGWQYLCTVLQSQAYSVRARLASAGSMDALLALNADIREAETYTYLMSMPDNIINEFTLDLERADED